MVSININPENDYKVDSLDDFINYLLNSEHPTPIKKYFCDWIINLDLKKNRITTTKAASIRTQVYAVLATL